MTKTHSRAYKFALHPEQCSNELCVEFLNQCFGHTRFIYNYFLNYRSESYKKHGLHISYKDTSKALTLLKKSEEYQWLKDIPSIPLQQKLRHLDNAFKKFFKKESRYPRFKKAKARQSASFLTSGNTRVEDGYVVISQHKKVFHIPFTKHRDFDFKNVKSFNISKESNGKYYISCVVEEAINQLPKNSNIRGFDLGIKDYLVDSDGVKTPSLKPLIRNEKKLKRAQRSLSRKEIGSNNRAKARIIVAKLHERVKHQRHDFLHQTSKRIINENQVIILETLKVKNMVKNRKLAKHISDAAWGKFVELVTYKAKWYGRTIVPIDQFFPSSKRCSACGSINSDLKLSDRVWTCECGEVLDRDHNAAINILHAGINEMAQDKDLYKVLKSVLEHMDVKYCGDDVRSALTSTQSSMKQDATTISA